MKAVFLRLVAGATIKLGVAYAARIVSNALAALRGVLAGGSLSDEARRNIEAIVAVLAVVGDFLSRLSDLLGAPAVPLGVDGRIGHDVKDAADVLRQITDSL